MKKTISFLLLITSLVECYSNPKPLLKNVDKIDLKLTSENGLIEQYLENDKAKDFIKDVNQLNIKKIANRDAKGWNLFARGLNEKNQEVFNISFISNQINIDNEWYETNQNDLEEIAARYKKWHYSPGNIL